MQTPPPLDTPSPTGPRRHTTSDGRMSKRHRPSQEIRVLNATRRQGRLGGTTGQIATAAQIGIGSARLRLNALETMGFVRRYAGGWIACPPAPDEWDRLQRLTDERTGKARPSILDDL